MRPAAPRTAEWPAPLIRNGHGSSARARSTGVPRLPRDLHAPHRVVTPAGLVAIGLLVLLCSAHSCAAGAAARCEAFCRRYGPPDLVLALGDDTSDEKTFAAVQQWSTEQRCLHSAIPRKTSRLSAPLSLVRERGPSGERRSSEPSFTGACLRAVKCVAVGGLQLHSRDGYRVGWDSAMRGLVSLRGRCRECSGMSFLMSLVSYPSSNRTVLCIHTFHQRLHG